MTFSSGTTSTTISRTGIPLQADEQTGLIGAGRTNF